MFGVRLDTFPSFFDCSSSADSKAYHKDLDSPVEEREEYDDLKHTCPSPSNGKPPKLFLNIHKLSQQLYKAEGLSSTSSSPLSIRRIGAKDEEEEVSTSNIHLSFSTEVDEEKSAKK